MSEFVNPPAVNESIYTNLSLRDREQLILVKNPNSSNSDLVNEVEDEIRSLNYDFEVSTLTTKENKFETNVEVREAIGENPEKTAVISLTGDGGASGIVRACADTEAVYTILPLGHANNSVRSLFPFFDRHNIPKIVAEAGIVKTKPIELEVTYDDKRDPLHLFVLDQLSIGDYAYAAEALNSKEHRELRKQRGKITSFIADMKVSKEAIDSHPEPFAIKRGRIDPEQVEDNRVTELYNSLLYSNIGFMALTGRIRHIKMTDPKIIEATNRHKTKFGAVLYSAKLGSYGLSGLDIADGTVTEFDLLTDTVLQAGGDEYHIPAGSHLNIHRNKKLYVATTRLRP